MLNSDNSSASKHIGPTLFILIAQFVSWFLVSCLAAAAICSQPSAPQPSTVPARPAAAAGLLAFTGRINDFTSGDVVRPAII